MKVSEHIKAIDGVEYELAARDEGTGYFGSWFCRRCWKGGVKYDLVSTVDDALSQAERGAISHHEDEHRSSHSGQFKLRYVKRRWDESRGDQFDSWGPSWWYFEIDAINNALRQIEDYDNGPTNGYDRKHDDDEMGGLTDQPLDDLTQDYEEISADTFNALWSNCTNRT